MILKSRPWKESLLRQAEKYKSWLAEFNSSDTDEFELEKETFLAAFTIRKLIEAKKLSDEIFNIKIKSMKYPSTGTPVPLMNWHKIDKLYRMKKGKKDSIPLRKFCNLLIHSHVFHWEYDNKSNLHSILFSSDKTKNKFLYKVTISEIINVLNIVGNDYPDPAGNESSNDKKE